MTEKALVCLIDTCLHLEIASTNCKKIKISSLIFKKRYNAQIIVIDWSKPANGGGIVHHSVPQSRRESNGVECSGFARNRLNRCLYIYILPIIHKVANRVSWNDYLSSANAQGYFISDFQYSDLPPPTSPRKTVSHTKGVDASRAHPTNLQDIAGLVQNIFIFLKCWLPKIWNMPNHTNLKLSNSHKKERKGKYDTSRRWCIPKFPAVTCHQAKIQDG